MSKIIATLRIVRLEASQGYVKEILLWVEIALLIILLGVVVIPINNSIVLISGFEHSIKDYKNLIYYTQAYGNNKEINVNAIADEINEKIHIYRSSHVLAKYGDNESVKLLILSEDLFQDLSIKLSLGEKEKDKVLISPHLSMKYKMGDSIFLNVEQGSEELIVSGVLDKYSIITDIQQIRGSTKAIYALCTSIVEYKDIDFIIMCENSIFPLSSECEALAVVIPEQENIHATIEKLNRKYSDSGEFYSYNQLKQFEFEKTFNNLSWEKMFLLLIIITTIFSLIGNTVVNIRQKHHLNAILNICGLSQKKLIAIIGLYFGLVVIPGIFFGIKLLPIVVKILNLVYYGISSLVIVVIMVVISMAMIIGICLANSIRRNASIIKQYKV